MGYPIQALTVFLLLISRSCCTAQSNDQGHISAELFNKGLDFLKDLLIEKAETSLVPLQLPTILKVVKIPIIGKVLVEASNITIFKIHVTSSTVQAGDTGILIDVSGATANLTANWKYSYSTWWLPIALEDEGEALIQVDGMEFGLSLSIKTERGSLKLSVLEAGCYVKDLSILLDGGASWLYQGFVDAFDSMIISRIESSITKKVKQGIESLNSLLESLPKEVAVDNVAALNVTIVEDPVLTNSSLSIAIDGLFSTKNSLLISKPCHKNMKGPPSCSSPARMVSISIHESVLESASLVYFTASKMSWIVDKVPDQSLLNTAGWKFIVPQLYKQYPNHDMSLNVSASSPPMLKIVKQEIDATIPLVIVINVLDAGEMIPVACISVVISGAASPEVSSNALGGSVKLKAFTMSLEWSKVGNLHMYLVQSVVSTLLKTVVMPYVNLKLNQGFPLPLFYGYGLQNTQFQYSGSWIVACSNVASFDRLKALSPPVVLPQ